MNIISTIVVGVLTLVGIIMAPISLLPEDPSPITVNMYAGEEEEEKEENRKEKNEALKSWIQRLAFCESSNNPSAINPDDGGSPSYGYLQWKTRSFFAYNRKYQIIPDLEYHEVKNIIMCRDTQIALTKKVLLNEANGRGWRNWWNCARRVGVAELDKIRKAYALGKQ